MYGWLIIGGGIHGTLLSHYLLKAVNVQADRLRVLDPYEKPLALWNRLTTNVGMEYLRSPHVHNLHFDPYALATFAQTNEGRAHARFIPQYNRPSLDLFRAHNQQLIERNQLDRLRITGRAHALRKLQTGWRVETETGGIDARNVILAFGVTEQPAYPDWALDGDFESQRIHHIFDYRFDHQQGFDGDDLVIVGGGITAAQTALAYTRRGAKSVTLLMRHPIRIHAFDSDTCWVVPQCLDKFHREQNFDRRRTILREVRHRGSMPADVDMELRNAIQQGLLRLRYDEVQAVQPEANHLNLMLRSGDSLQADHIILATGFNARRPGGAWLDQAVDEYRLPTAACGYPIPDESLCWSPGLYVSGALAELMVGPTARNIIGARLAAYRIGDAAKHNR